MQYLWFKALFACYFYILDTRKKISPINIGTLNIDNFLPKFLEN